MAFRDTIDDHDASDFLDAKFFYNLGSSVGYGCPNRPNDVRLVQYFINVHNEGYSWIFGKKIAVDGDYGGKTWNAIKMFQQQIGYNGAGTVSSPNGPQYVSPKTRCFYTIIYLNSTYKQSYPTYWPDIRRDPNLPSEIKAHLSGPLPQQ